MELTIILGIAISAILGFLAGLSVEFFLVNAQIKSLERDNQLLQLKLDAVLPPIPIRKIEIADDTLEIKDYFKKF